MTYPAPWSAQIEAVEGCSRMCACCGIHGMWRTKEDRVLKFMTVDLAGQVAKSLRELRKGKGCRVEFALQGEPTLNPDLVDIIRIFRKNFPECQLLVSTNDYVTKFGSESEFDEKYVYDLFSAGLNILLLENYDGTIQRENMKKNAKSLRRGIIFGEYYEGDNVYSYRGNKHRRVVLMDDIMVHNREKKTRTIFNHAGNVNFDIASKYGVQKLEKPLEKMCINPFRELVVNWDGTVTACCMDWNRELIVGKFPELSLEKIWNGDAIHAVRALLYKKIRSITPCNRCDYPGGFRQGIKTAPPERFMDMSQEELEEFLGWYQDMMSQYRGKYAEWGIVK